MAKSKPGATPSTPVPKLVGRVAAQLHPVLCDLYGDARFAQRFRQKDDRPTTLDLAYEVVAWLKVDPYAAEREFALESRRLYSRPGFARTERETVNLSDLCAAGRLPAGPYHVVVPPLPPVARWAAWCVAIATAATAVTPLVITFDRAPDHTVTVSVAVGGAVTTHATLFEALDHLVWPHLSGRAEAELAFAHLNPWAMVADSSGRTLADIRATFFRDWEADDLDVFWDGNHWCGRWAKDRDGAAGAASTVGSRLLNRKQLVTAAEVEAEIARVVGRQVALPQGLSAGLAAGTAAPDELADVLFWHEVRWPGRVGSATGYLDAWLHRVLFLGAATGYLEFGDVQSNLGRSLVCRSLGFRTRNRVVCAVCGAADRPATGPHVCRGAPRWERPPLCREQNHHVAIAGVTADVRRHARCKSQARSPAAAVYLTAAPVTGAEPLPAPPPTASVQTRAGGAAFWLTPTDRTDSAATLTFAGAGAKVEVWAVVGTDRCRLAELTLTATGARVVRREGEAAPLVRATNGGVVVPLLYRATLVALTGAPTAGGSVAVVVEFAGCGHVWEHDVPDVGRWEPGPCPRCGGPDVGGPLQLWAGRPTERGDESMPFQTDDNRCAAPLVAIGEPLAGFRLEVIDVGQGRVDVYLHPDNGLPAVGPLNMSRDEFHNWLAQQTHTGGTDGYVPLPPEPELDEGDTPDDRSGDEPNATDPIDAPDGGNNA